MSGHHFDVYIPIVILISIAVLMVVGAMVVGKLIRPSNPTKEKLMAYECGEDPIGVAWSNFNVRFYVVSLIFIIFDVEGALMFPVATVFKKFNDINLGGPVLASLLLFIGVLTAGIVYCWSKGDLDWVRSYHGDNQKNKA